MLQAYALGDPLFAAHDRFLTTAFCAIKAAATVKLKTILSNAFLIVNRTVPNHTHGNSRG